MPEAAKKDGGCLFCDIAARRAPAQIVYEDAKAIAFLDLFPVTRGHLLVVPKRHVDRLTELPREDHADFLEAVSRCCRKVERLSQHYNVSMNQGSLAGQIVFHLHFHIIPRYEEGTPQWSHPRARLSESEGRSVVSALSSE